jgi:hypothetical protein
MALKERRLISIKDKFITINHPSLEWFNDVKISLMNRIKSWNKNEYPLFYLENEKDLISGAKKYAQLIDQEIAGNLSEEDAVALKSIKDWIELFKNYPSELNNLLDERVSLEFNLKMLKDLNLYKGEARDVQITIKKDGKFVTEIITLRKEDYNLKLTINNLKEQIKLIDGSLGKIGRLQERVIKQAMAMDLMTIIQRELEYSVKNSSTPSNEIVSQLEVLNVLLKDSDFNANSYGVFKIANQKFNKEVADLFNLKNPIKKTNPQDHTEITKAIESKITTPKTAENPEANNLTPAPAPALAPANDNSNAPKRTGPLSTMYSKIASLTPYQKFMVTAKLSAIGYGAYKFFWFKKSGNTVEIITEKKPQDPVMAKTQKIEDQNTKKNSSVIEIHLENLITRKNNLH